MKTSSLKDDSAAKPRVDRGFVASRSRLGASTWQDPRVLAPPSKPCDLSIIIPIYNEEENIEPLYHELVDVLSNLGLEYEIIFVDDGSTDRSLPKLSDLARNHQRVLVVELRRNFGQTAAMSAGIQHSCGKILIPMDGDRQNDPAAIPELIRKMEGPPEFDIVSGWRKDRKDKLWTRRVPSQIANAIIRKFTKVPIHDFGCTLKAYRREVLEDISLSSDLHRFLPALATWHGAKITEIVVNHRPRVAGRTKYGLWRTFRVVLDLLIVKFMTSYATRPLYFFGKIGLVTLPLSAIVLLIAIGQKFQVFGGEAVKLNRNVLVSLSALLAFLTVQCLLFGLVAEMLVRVYHDISGRPTYHVRQLHYRREGSDG